ncbi:MAG TPA: hypothetical protein VKT82_12020 [Ktedonobacterales bacterium]|nr:hypothetical protein [Ktedonobacterales bacterium]
MHEPCPRCGSPETRSGRRSRRYYNRHGPVIAPGCLAVIVLMLGCVLFALGEWLLPTFRREFFVLGAVAVLAPLALPFQYLRYQRAFNVRQRCLTCGHRWRALTS